MRGPSRRARFGFVGAAFLASLLAPYLASRWGPAADGDRGVRALEAGALDEAVILLSRAAEGAGDPDVRFRALHGLALARLLQARRGPPETRAALARASVEAARDALRLEPTSDGTRHNLVHAQRLLEYSEGAGDVWRPGDTREGAGDPPATEGVRGPGASEGPGSASGSGPVGAGGGRTSWSRAEAEALLDALASAEAAAVRAALHGTLAGPGSRSGASSSVRSYRGRPW